MEFIIPQNDKIIKNMHEFMYNQCYSSMYKKNGANSTLQKKTL